MPSTRATTDSAAAPEVLTVRGLSVEFATRHQRVRAVEDVSLSIARGECLGVVGESGAGKSQLFLAVLGIAAGNARVTGSARFGTTELVNLPAAALDRIRGGGIGMVFQDPLTSLTPHIRVGEQIAEVLRRHGTPAAQAPARALQLLQQVQVNDAERRVHQYPYELSGGMRQRVMIAIAISGAPQLLIADEPTTALDVTVQAQILKLLADLKRSRSMALVLITHDLAALAGVADRVLVMRAGRIVESGPVAQVLKSPREPYTQQLLRAARAVTTLAVPPPASSAQVQGPAALSLTDVSVEFAVTRGWLRSPRQLAALSGVDLSIAPGESCGIVGESGSGKSTLARAALRLLLPRTGRILWMGQALEGLPRAELRRLRRDRQIIFQDPLGSLDPRLSVAEIVAEPLAVHEPSLGAAGRTRAVAAALEAVALPQALAARYPHELSGGQCQRVGIARAMILKPALLVADEPVSALDVPTQEQIVTLLQELTAAHGMSLMFISHNLALVRRLCARVLVLYLGRMMELAPVTAIFAAPRHPYTRELLAAIPSTDPDIQPQRLAQVRWGEPPSPLDPPSGCVYRTRCPHALAVCAERVPLWESTTGDEARVACHRWREL
jgi:oligopeptide/dipeptide ABC transporter ATP-binding protein